MKNIFAFSLLLCAICSQNVNAQEKMKDPTRAEKTEKPDNYIYKSLEKNAEFPGGISKFGEFFVNNFNFPDELTESIRLKITFVVEKDGSLTDVKLSSSIGYGIPEEVQRIFAMSPKWEPGYDNGKPVRSLFSFPITLQFE